MGKGGSFLVALCLVASSGVCQTASDPELLSARQLLQADRIGEAETAIRDYLKQHDDSADAHYLLGYTLFRRQKPALSLEEYTKGARYRDPSAYDLEVVGSDYVLLGAYSDAAKWFAKSIGLNPANISARYYLGRAKYNENRFEEAVQVFQDCLKLDPKNVRAGDNLGLSYEGLGRWEEAAAAYRRAISWQEDLPAGQQSARPLFDLGTLLVTQNKPEEALPHLQKAAMFSPADAATHRQLGKAYLHLDRLEAAQRELETAVRLDPSNAPTHFILAQVFRKRGMADEARRESERYTALTGTQASKATP